MLPVCKSWHTGFLDSVTAVRMAVTGYRLNPLPSVSQFQGLRSVTLLGSLEGVSFRGFLGSRVQILDLSGCEGVDGGVLGGLKGVPVTDLDVSHSPGVDDGCVKTLSHLGLPLMRLDISRTKVGDKGLRELQKLTQLRSLRFREFAWENLGGGEKTMGILKGLPLTSLALGGLLEGSEFADLDDDQHIFDFDRVSDLRGMQLTDLSIDGGDAKFTDEGLAGLLGLPLVSFEGIFRGESVSDAGMAGLRGKPLEKLSLEVGESEFNITPAGWAVFRGMPLKSLSLNGEIRISDETLAALQGAPLEFLSANGYGFEGNVTDVGMAHLKGMPLTHLDVRAVITDQGFACLGGLPLTFLHLGYGGEGSEPISDQGFIAGLRGKRLVDLQIPNLGLVSDVGFAVLRDMPLIKLSLWTCNLITDASFQVLKRMPMLEKLSINGCTRITDLSLEFLNGSSIKDLTLFECSFLTWMGLRSLRCLPLKSLSISFRKTGARGNLSDIIRWDMASLREAESSERE